MKKLTSVFLQPMMNYTRPDLDLFMPILKFGKSKKDEYRVDIIFHDRKIASECLNLLRSLIGNEFEDVKKAVKLITECYAPFHYHFTTNLIKEAKENGGLSVEEKDLFYQINGIDNQGDFQISIQKDCSQIRMETSDDNLFIDLDYRKVKAIRDCLSRVLTEFDEHISSKEKP